MKLTKTIRHGETVVTVRNVSNRTKMIAGLYSRALARMYPALKNPQQADLVILMSSLTWVKAISQVEVAEKWEYTIPEPTADDIEIAAAFDCYENDSDPVIWEMIEDALDLLAQPQVPVVQMAPELLTEAEKNDPNLARPGENFSADSEPRSRTQPAEKSAPN